jgi:malonate-semialdehyde dehydrogenase (acetylating)/methylmalonate-semialdehyde dehydrogenase
MQISHFINGKRTAGQSKRTADVMNPNTGQVQATAPMASAADVDAAVAGAVEAQKEWAAFNPQRRARVMMKFVDLVNQNVDELAELLSLEHGKTVADSKGDIQRGVEVIEFAVGIPHLLKGEYTEGAGTGIDVYSLRQPLGVVAGITPFNFPAMIPLWKAGPALACGNAFILKPSERDPSVPVRLAELFLEADCRPVCSRWCTATRKPSTRYWRTRTSRPTASSAAPTSRSTSTPLPRRTASARSASAAPRTT